MATQKSSPRGQISVSAIILGAFIAIGFLIMFAALAIAASAGVGLESDKLSFDLMLIIGATVSIIIIILTFFIAGLIASAMSRQLYLFDSIVHSIGSWAVMAIFLFALMSGAVTVNAMKRVIDGLHYPQIVTDIYIWKERAITTIDGKEGQTKHTQLQIRNAEILSYGWWIITASILCGLGAAIGGSLVGRRVSR